MDALEGLDIEERDAATAYMREAIRDELYGNLILRTALKAAAAYRVADHEDTAKARFDDVWNDRYIEGNDGRKGFRKSIWGHNLGYVSGDWFVFLQIIRSAERKDQLTRALWVLLDLAVVAMFGPVGNNYDEPVPEEV
jgi:hypothetical protein